MANEEDLNIFATETGVGPQQEKRIQQILNEIDIKNSTFVIGYGAKAQKDVAQFSDKVLRHMMTDDTGGVAAELSEMMVKVDEVDGDNLLQKGVLSSLPIIGSFFNKANKYIVQYEKVSIGMERITQQLEKSQIQLIRDITMLDGLLEKNKEYLQELDLYIEAGKRKIYEIRQQTIPALQEKSTVSKELQTVQALNEMIQFADRFEKRIHNLLLSRAITIQTGPQIRMIQESNQVLAEKIQSSILQTIPLWKQQLVIALTLARQKKILKTQREVTKTTNDLMKQNSELVKQGTVQVAGENERAVVEIETLKSTQVNLIAALKETLTIQNEGRRKREKAQTELQQLETELQNKMEEIVYRSEK